MKCWKRYYEGRGCRTKKGRAEKRQKDVLEKTRAQETPMKPKKAADSEHAKAAKTGARAIVEV